MPRTPKKKKDGWDANPLLHGWLTQFMLDSNGIEGEPRINPGDIDVIENCVSMAINARRSDAEYFKLNREILLAWHRDLSEHRKDLTPKQKGAWRTIPVYVGRYVPPDPSEVPGLMKQWEEKLPKMDSWQAHNMFEAIHPFVDLNGRIGRLVWLYKAMRDEGYNFKIGFLHLYYYQTLNHDRPLS